MAAAELWWKMGQDYLLSAQLLEKNGQLNATYNLVGQSVEFSLKAIYMKRKVLQEWPDSHKGANWHDLSLIAEKCGLNQEISNLKTDQVNVFTNWLIVRAWKSNGRFPGNLPKSKDVRDLYSAVCSKKHGIMNWLTVIYHSS